MRAARGGGRGGELRRRRATRAAAGATPAAERVPPGFRVVVDLGQGRPAVAERRPMILAIANPGARALVFAIYSPRIE